MMIESGDKPLLNKIMILSELCESNDQKGKNFKVLNSTKKWSTSLNIGITFVLNQLLF